MPGLIFSPLLLQEMHRLGGRMATRVVAAGDRQGQQLVFDHAAQFFTTSDERFKRVVDEWIDKGLVHKWRGLISELEAGGHFRPIPSSTPRYIGMNGMRPLVDAILPESRLYAEMLAQLLLKKKGDPKIGDSETMFCIAQSEVWVEWHSQCGQRLAWALRRQSYWTYIGWVLPKKDGIKLLDAVHWIRARLRWLGKCNAWRWPNVWRLWPQPYANYGA
ncbi:hypothetical protein E2562_017775 [Oryza meyeriana var. granulata]|uniref:Uncharacterized protein n=1 Tax=Oryza meyeriana var. granulata TaxID=110450 RepID=A0A6G1BLD4_9ORYZ|nr:hypothetical protein E2562_017775 [Oryza meyeriana var. granulata]